MPPFCRLQTPLAPQQPQIVSVASLKASPHLTSARQRKTISLTETYSVATTCRSKLGKEAGRADHELRRLVGHANMLDMLIDMLLDTEREQEVRVNEMVPAALKPQQLPKVQWIDHIAAALEEEEESDSDDDSDDDSDFGDDIAYKLPVRKAKSPLPKLSSGYFDSTLR